MGDLSRVLALAMLMVLTTGEQSATSSGPGNNVIAKIFLVKDNRKFIHTIEPIEISRVSCHYYISGNKTGKELFNKLISLIKAESTEYTAAKNPIDSRLEIISNSREYNFDFVSSYTYANGKSLGVLNGAKVFTSPGAVETIRDWISKNRDSVLISQEPC